MTTYRAVFLSDLHLGSRGCRAEELLAFLRVLRGVRKLYLVGDIVDVWARQRSRSWPDSHEAVFRELMELSRRVDVVYVVGNHDEDLDFLVGSRFGRLAIERDAEHVLADGRQLWVVHGDAFDPIVLYHPVLAHLGSLAYEVATVLNRWARWLRVVFGKPRWSLADYLHRRMKHLGDFLRLYEVAVTDEARRRGYAGVVCGHVHVPAMKTVNGVLYLNDGDGVDSCSALVEMADGELKHVYWHHIFDPRAERGEDASPVPEHDMAGGC